MIRAHHGPAVLSIGVDGPATMLESAAVQEVADESVAEGARELFVDLRDCTTMDSTFSGTLLSLERRLQGCGGQLTLVSPSPRVMELLRQMGLEDFYKIEEAEPTPTKDDDGWTEISTASPSVDKLKQVVIESHEELANLPSLAAPAFRTVVEELRKDARRQARRSDA